MLLGKLKTSENERLDSKVIEEQEMIKEQLNQWMERKSREETKDKTKQSKGRVLREKKRKRTGCNRTNTSSENKTPHASATG